MYSGFPGGSDGKESACSAGDLGSIPGSGRSPAEGNGNPLENPMDGGAWQATVHGVAKSWLQLSKFTFYFLLCTSDRAKGYTSNTSLNTYNNPRRWGTLFFLSLC